MNTLEDWIREQAPLWEKPMEKCGACPSRQRTGAVPADNRLPTQEEILAVLDDLVSLVLPLCFSEGGVPEIASVSAARPVAEVARRLHDLVAPVRRYYREVVEGLPCEDADAFARAVSGRHNKPPPPHPKKSAPLPPPPPRKWVPHPPRA